MKEYKMQTFLEETAVCISVREICKNKERKREKVLKRKREKDK
jgi:hypothetical protein